MIEQQQKLVLSPYMEIYELVIPKDNLLRQIKELVDFSFIYDELLANYCLDNGRNAVPCKLCLNGMPVPLLRNCYSIFNGTKYR